jgi:hypothetical protein
MPRSPLRPDPHVERIRSALDDYVGAVRGRQMQIERATGVKQFTVSRFISGRTRKLSAEIRRVCDYAGISVDPGIDIRSDDARLQMALSRVWDGRAESAELIAVFIESLGPVLQTMMRQRAKSKLGE